MSNLPSIDGMLSIHGRMTVIPVHAKETIGVGLFQKILKDCELTIDEFLKTYR